MNSGQIDVVLPTFNAARYLKDSIESVLHQTLRSIRVLIIDDGSTDDTAEVVDGIRARDHRVLYFRQDNGGIVSALNAGLKLCEAPYIARQDADDLSDPNRLERQLAYMQSNPDCVALSCLARHIDANGSLLSTVTTLKDLSIADDDSIPANEPYLLHPMLMMRTADIMRIGGYRYVYNAEDSDLYWRLEEQNRLHILPEVLGSYRLHASSLSSASIVSGRQTSVWSQLAAISAQRRRAGKSDLTFDTTFMSTVRHETTLEGAFRAASTSLDQGERVWLSSAASAKLLELAYYRPFEPERSDITFIRQSKEGDPDLPQRRGYVTFQEAILSASIRLVIEGRLLDALALSESALWPKLLARVLFRMAVPESLKRRLKRQKSGGQPAANRRL